MSRAAAIRLVSERSRVAHAMRDMDMLRLFSKDRRAEALLLLSPLALLPEVAADPHALWRPQILQRRLSEVLRTRTFWSPEAQGAASEARARLADADEVAAWLRRLREVAVPTQTDGVAADRARREAVALLRGGRPSAAHAVVRSALLGMPDHPYLRRLEIATLRALGELTEREAVFALSALPEA